MQVEPWQRDLVVLRRNRECAFNKWKISYCTSNCIYYTISNVDWYVIKFMPVIMVCVMTLYGCRFPRNWIRNNFVAKIYCILSCDCLFLMILRYESKLIFLICKMFQICQLLFVWDTLYDLIQPMFLKCDL